MIPIDKEVDIEEELWGNRGKRAMRKTRVYLQAIRVPIRASFPNQLYARAQQFIKVAIALRISLSRENLHQICTRMVASRH